MAILTTLGNLFERIVCGLLTDHFRCYVSDFQHGFIQGRSTTTNLLSFTQFALAELESGNQVDVVYTDFSKAFDRLRHDHLIWKLSEIGVHSSMLSWIRSYLQGRLQYVRLAGWESERFCVTSGVPQGSHLGPLLFNLFLNDVFSIFSHCNALAYADDLKLYCSVRTVRDAVGLQRDLDSLSSWCQRNGLFLNIKKCKVVSFHRKTSPMIFDYNLADETLERVNVVRDLGVLFDEKIQFSKHIDAVISKSYSMLGFMKRICSEFEDPEVLKTIYCAIVRSHLEYSSVLWTPNYAVHISRIESIQKKFVLYALRRIYSWDESHSLASYSER